MVSETQQLNRDVFARYMLIGWLAMTPPTSLLVSLLLLYVIYITFLGFLSLSLCLWTCGQ